MKTDKDSKSKSQLINAFRQLLQEKPFSKISVDDIVTRAELSRQSFYRNFYDKYGLLFCIYKDAVDKIRKRHAANELTGTSPETVAYIKQNAHIYKDLGCDLAVPNPFMNQWYEYCRQHLVDNIGAGKLTPELENAMRFYLNACWFFLYEYMVGHINGTPEDISKIILSNMPDILKPFFR